MRRDDIDYMLDRVESKAWNSYFRYYFFKAIGFILGIIFIFVLFGYLINK